MQEIDLEGSPPEVDGDHQPAPSRPTISRRKRAVTAVVSVILVVAAIVVGAVLSGKPNQSVPAAGVSFNNHDAITSNEQKKEGSGVAANDNENLAEFDGPLADFIATGDVARISVSANNQCTNANEGLWYMQFNTDKYPWENAWTLKDSNGKVVMSGPPEGRNYDRLTKYVGSMCVAAGKYTVTLNDKGKDGICCEYGQGSMIIKVNGKVVASTGNSTSNFETFQRTITVTPSNAVSPTPGPTQASGPTGKEYAVVVSMLTDDYGKETGYIFESVKDGSKLINRPQGTLKPNTKYKNTLMLQAGQYRLTVDDELAGIQEPGGYSVEVEDQEVLRDNKAKSYIIHVGYNPSMTVNEENWLSQHNSRRQAFHESEGVSYRPLVWSPKLAKDASDWVDVLLSNSTSCKTSSEPGITEGENVSARIASGQRNEGPVVILQRWADKQANKTFPENQSRTQVLWRATRYLGCSEKFSVLADGSRCYASVCRYSRPGNCNMNKFDSWEIPTLADSSKCGDECPNDVCY